MCSVVVVCLDVVFPGGIPGRAGFIGIILCFEQPQCTEILDTLLRSARNNSTARIAWSVKELLTPYTAEVNRTWAAEAGNIGRNYDKQRINN